MTRVIAIELAGVWNSFGSFEATFSRCTYMPAIFDGYTYGMVWYGMLKLGRGVWLARGIVRVAFNISMVR